MDEVPVPVSATVAVAPVDELLLIVRVPVRAVAVTGAKVTGMASVWPGVKVLGKPVVVAENAVPLTAMELMVTAEVPDEVRVTERAFVVPSVTLP